MPVAATIVASVAAKTDNFERGMKRARGSLKGFQAQTSQTLNVVRNLAGILGASFSVAAFVGGIKRSYESLDRLAKTADRLGIATEGLQTLRFAAELAGSSTEALDKAIQKMLRTIGDAKTGLATYVRVFDQLGLSAENLSKISADTAFGMIADAINKMPSAADKAAAAMQIFGRSGAELINTMEGGSRSIDNARTELEKMGFLVDRVLIKKVEQANDAWTTFGRSVQAVFQKIAIKTAGGARVAAEGAQSIASGEAFSAIGTLLNDPGGIGNQPNLPSGFKLHRLTGNNLKAFNAEVDKLKEKLNFDEAFLSSGLRVQAIIGAAATQGEAFAESFIKAAKQTADRLNDAAPMAAFLFGSDKFFAGKKGGRFGFFGNLAEGIVKDIQRQLSESAAAIAESTLSPGDDIRTRIRDLKNARSRLTPDQFALAALQIKNDAESLLPFKGSFQSPLFAETAQFGSRAAFEARQRFLKPPDRDDPGKTLKDILKELEEQTRIERDKADQAVIEFAEAGL